MPAKTITESQLKYFVDTKKQMTVEQKQRLLKTLRVIKEQFNGNRGGTTDITNADNFMLENEFTAAEKPDKNPIARTFKTKGSVEEEAKKVQGSELSKQDIFALNEFGLVKEAAAPQPAPQPKPPAPTQAPKQAPQQPTSQPVKQPNANQQASEPITVLNEVEVVESIIGKTDTEVANILSDFIHKLELKKTPPTVPNKFEIRFTSVDANNNNVEAIIKKIKRDGGFAWYLCRTFSNPIKNSSEEN